MYKQLLSTLSFAAIMTGCGPADIASEGSSSETGAAELPVPGAEVRCVEMMPGVKTCWVDWLPGVDARVILECTAAEAVTAGAWSPAYEDVLDYWGQVLCHDVIGTAGAVCLFGDTRVQLTRSVEGWLPDLSTSVGLFPSVDPPCDDICVSAAPDPTCPAGLAGCKCTCEDLNDDGMTPGECYPGAALECIDGFCVIGCPTESLGCPCGEGGACADLLECFDGVCGSCPSGQPGCECQPSDLCDVGLACVDGSCE